MRASTSSVPLFLNQVTNDININTSLQCTSFYLCIINNFNDLIHLKDKPLKWQRLFPFCKQAMPFVTVNAIIGNQAFQNGQCHICFSSGLDKVETGYNLLTE